MNVADYPISKEAVVQMLIDLRNSLGNERYISIGITMALGKLDGFPPVVADGVVRCKDCQYYTRALWLCNNGLGVRTFDFYCAEGKKKDAKDMDVPTKDGGASDGSD